MAINTYNAEAVYKAFAQIPPGVCFFNKLLRLLDVYKPFPVQLVELLFKALFVGTLTLEKLPDIGSMDNAPCNAIAVLSQ